MGKATARINGSILCGKCNYAMLPRMRGGKHIISCIMTGCSEFEVYYKEPTVNLELELEPIEIAASARCSELRRHLDG